MDSSAPDDEARDNRRFTTYTDVFAMARSTFGWLVTGPDPVSVDGREIPGLPPRPVPLDELGALLRADGCAQATRDAAWTYLITRARAERGTWTVACVGMALPALLRAATSVTRHFTGDRHDINAAVLTAFVQELDEVDLARPAILARLYYVAFRAGLLALDDAVGKPIPAGDLVFNALRPPPPEGHPELVLEAAVHAGAITAEQAALISETRLGDTTLADAARSRGLRYRTVQKGRARAEARLVTYLRDERRDTSAAHGSANSRSVTGGARPGTRVTSSGSHVRGEVGSCD
ncbi:sigma-70 family RNA polymerase sigma factor [Amycolatopsis speibonae]|uniref:Sigma-70 family RNA polymerase sigma factor n=1 Tax=Amycolatopsis speibonae TaxID=1450224 RepID=A0ABV7P5F0_9PSEU